MNYETAIYTPTHPYQFRCGQPAEIVGVYVVTPEGKPARACFKLRWPDGFEDLSPIEDDDFTGKPTYTITAKP
jgi:hypothetical protein